MLWEILKASKGILVADFYADLWANLAGGGTPVDVFVEMIGSPPLYYNGKGYDLTDYLISGNTIQDGTPSPDAPVDATGCGVRTGNLWDEDYTGISGTLTYVPVYVGNGSFTLSTSCSTVERAAALFLLAGNVQSGASTARNGVYEGRPITVSSIDGYVTVVYREVVYASGSALPQDEKTMLNPGSTALPYEPYGYKLPPTVNGTEYPIYLGTVPTTRKVKKLVLTGEESTWTKSTRYPGNFYASLLATTLGRPIISTHAVYTVIIDQAHFTYGKVAVDGSSSLKNINLFIGQPSWTIDDFKTYLAQQYAAGTPVTVWYVLAEPETAVVNEPLMKIGDYADTISAEQAGVTIPTVSGANVLDMTSPVKPSEVYVKGKGIKPTGYGQLTDVNGANILDKDGRPIYVHGQ